MDLQCITGRRMEIYRMGISYVCNLEYKNGEFQRQQPLRTQILQMSYKSHLLIQNQKASQGRENRLFGSCVSYMPTSTERNVSSLPGYTCII